MENSEINPIIEKQLIFDKNAMNTQWDTVILFLYGEPWQQHL